MLTIRTSTPDDADAVQRVTDLAFESVRLIYRPNPAAMANLQSIAPALERLVAEVDGQIVGTVRFGVFDDCLRVIGLAVLPQLRRSGVARSLIQSLEEIARDKRCRALSLYTVTKTGNVAVFERLGFTLISQGPDTYSISTDGEPLTEAYMERSIA